MKQDIWKQNDNKNTIQAVTKITKNDYDESMLNNKSQLKTELSQTYKQ